MRAEFGEDPLDVGSRRLPGDAETVGDLGAPHSQGQQRQHLPFTRRQLRASGKLGRRLGWRPQPRLSADCEPTNSRHDPVDGERLGEEVVGTEQQRGDLVPRDAASARAEDRHRQLGAESLSQRLEHLEAGQLGQVHRHHDQVEGSRGERREYRAAGLHGPHAQR